MKPDTTERLRPWLAIAIPALAWYALELGSLSALSGHCEAVGGWLGLVGGGVCLACCGIAARIAWPARSPVDDGTPPRRWLTHVALLADGIFALAIALQTLSTFIVPPCAQ